MLKNFSVIKRYNVSTSYALAVGHLSDRLRGGGPFEKPWPRNSVPLNAEQRVKLQQLLMTRGYYSGVPDGEIGSGSREAIRAYQLAVGFTPDGVPSLKVLQALEAGK